MCDVGDYVELNLPNIGRVDYVDRCMALFLCAVNELGFQTRSHCCGHGYQSPFIIIYEPQSNSEILYTVDENGGFTVHQDGRQAYLDFFHKKCDLIVKAGSIKDISIKNKFLQQLIDDT